MLLGSYSNHTNVKIEISVYAFENLFEVVVS